MKTNRTLDLLSVLVALLPLGYLLLVYPQLPSRLPTHFGLNGQPDALESKATLFTLAGILAGAGVFIWLVFRYLPRLDPKQNLQYSAGALQKLALGVNGFIAVIGVLAIRSAQTGEVEALTGYLPFAAALLLAFVGNYLTHVRPNYFAGFRTPWTLSSDTVWRKTHQFGGVWLFWLCLAALVPMLFLPPIGRMVFLAIVVMIGVLYPVYYSYRLYREEKRHLA
jgi:hypothetical protein